MSDEADPPRKYFTFKPKEFEALNPPGSQAPASGGERTAADPLAAAGRIDVRDHFKSAAGDPQSRRLAAPGEHGGGNENDVHAMLRANHARAEAAGLNELAPKARRKSKRKRDYVLTMLVANPAMCAVFGFALYQRNPFLLAYAGAGIVLFNVSFTWVMWFVIDDY